jgi:hypothetical protein
MGIAPKPSGDPKGVCQGVFFVRKPLDSRLNIPVTLGSCQIAFQSHLEPPTGTKGPASLLFRVLAPTGTRD